MSALFWFHWQDLGWPLGCLGPGHTGRPAGWQRAGPRESAWDEGAQPATVGTQPVPELRGSWPVFGEVRRDLSMAAIQLLSPAHILAAGRVTKAVPG